MFTSIKSWIKSASNYASAMYESSGDFNHYWLDVNYLYDTYEAQDRHRGSKELNSLVSNKGPMHEIYRQEKLHGWMGFFSSGLQMDELIKKASPIANVLMDKFSIPEKYQILTSTYSNDEINLIIKNAYEEYKNTNNNVIGYGLHYYKLNAVSDKLDILLSDKVKKAFEEGTHSKEDLLNYKVTASEIDAVLTEQSIAAIKDGVFRAKELLSIGENNYESINYYTELLTDPVAVQLIKKGDFNATDLILDAKRSADKGYGSYSSCCGNYNEFAERVKTEKKAIEDANKAVAEAAAAGATPQAAVHNAEHASELHSTVEHTDL